MSSATNGLECLDSIFHVMIKANVGQKKLPLGRDLLKLGQTRSAQFPQGQHLVSRVRPSWTASHLASTPKRKHQDGGQPDKSSGCCRKKRTRSLDSFHGIPKSQQLKLLKISQKTFDQYNVAVQRFEQWAHKSGRRFSSHKSVDESMCLFLRELCEQGEPMSYGSYAVFWVD